MFSWFSWLLFNIVTDFLGITKVQILHIFQMSVQNIWAVLLIDVILVILLNKWKVLTFISMMVHVRDKENITVKSQSTSWTCDQFGVKSIIIFHQLQKIRPVFHLLGNTMTFKKFYSEKIFCFTFSKKYSTYTQLVIIKHLFLLYSFRNKDNNIYSSRSQNPSPLYPLSFGYNTKQVLRHINIQIFSNFNWNWFA